MMGFLIIDDHPLFGEALSNAIRHSHPDARIYEANSVEQALAVLASRSDIDLALLDLLLPDAVGFSGLKRIRDRHPRLPVAIVSSEEDNQTIREALQLGAVGYLPKSTSLGELSQAIAQVLSGSVSAPKDFVATRSPKHSETEGTLSERIKKLSPQQNRVLHLITRGLQNREIAIEMKLSESTVKAHVTEILRKLKLFSRNKAITELGKNALALPEARSKKPAKTP
jgi:DNA-binding NarL/FixJ family response regulator